MLKKIALFMLVAGICTQIFPHCEVPCGIYGDSLRFSLMNEHIETIAKSIDQINIIAKEKQPNYNQLVRWINTKENHANDFQHIVTQYFMTQRIIAVPPADDKYPKYVKQITLLHQLLVEAMKSKQSSNAEIPEKMKKLLHEFQNLYESKKSN